MLNDLVLKFPVPAAIFSAKTGALEMASIRWRATPELVMLSAAAAQSSDALEHDTPPAQFVSALYKAFMGIACVMPMAINGEYGAHAARLNFHPYRDELGDVERVVVWLASISHDTDPDMKLEMAEAVIRHGKPITDPWAYIAADGIFKYLNPGGVALTGIGGEAAVGSHYSKWFREKIGNIVAADYIARAIGGEALSYERRRLDHRINEERWHRITLLPDRTPNGSVLGVFVISTDVHERRIAEEKAKFAETRLEQERLSGAFVVIEFDENLRLTACSPQAEQLFGYTAAEAIGRNLRELGGLADVDAAEARMRDLIANPMAYTSPLRTKNRTRSGEILYIDWYRSATRNPIDKKVTVLSIGIDVTKEQRLRAQMLQSSRTDALTGLTNRDGLLDLVAKKIKKREPFSLLHIDLDRFKQINDYRGYPAGDQVLRGIAQRLSAAVLPGDCVGRIANDGFLVVLTPAADAIAANERERADILLSCVEPAQIFETFKYATTASAGYVPVSVGVGETAEMLFNQAELAMYKAKSTGRNRIVEYDITIAQEQNSEHEQAEALREVLRTKSLDVYFQPLLSVDGNHIIGGEALARWRMPDGEYVDPDRFIALAEELGLIHDLWSDVMMSACAMAVRLNTIQSIDGVAQRPCPISVNVSPVQLRFPAFDHLVVDALNAASCAPEWITLEVTESEALSDEAAFATLHNLAFMGVKCGVDDFGTGYSNFAHLKHLPLHSLKIDKTFVRALANRDHAIVRGMIELGHALGLKIVAEGVEYLEELNALKALGCDVYQGFIASKAIPAEDFFVMVAADRALHDGLSIEASD
jgi:diguanylate cyclase (GGDEF)-like protein/PAS domain S-box-containing protein